ncbi:MAG: ABC transporter substrate-binding protein [Bdellovibrionota bacterium]
MRKANWIIVACFMALSACASKGARSSSSTAAKASDDVVISAFSSNANTKEKAQAAQEQAQKELEAKAELEKTQAPAVLSKNSPTRVIQKYTDELRAIHETSKVKKANERDKSIANKVRQFFDFDSLARLSLGTHWDEIGADKQKDFSDLFIHLVENSYLQRSKTLVADYDLEYQKEKIKGNEAEVAINIARDDANIEIIYQLHKTSRDWMIYNIILENVDLIKNYQTQFNRVIAKSGINELLSLMRKKLKEEDMGVDVSL